MERRRKKCKDFNIIFFERAFSDLSFWSWFIWVLWVLDEWVCCGKGRKIWMRKKTVTELDRTVDMQLKFWIYVLLKLPALVETWNYIFCRIIYFLSFPFPQKMFMFVYFFGHHSKKMGQALHVTVTSQQSQRTQNFTTGYWQRHNDWESRESFQEAFRQI